MKYIINDEVMNELGEVECDCREDGWSIIEYYDRFGYDSEGGKLIKKYGSDRVRDEFIERIKKICKDNKERYYKIDWD